MNPFHLRNSKTRLSSRPKSKEPSSERHDKTWWRRAAAFATSVGGFLVVLPFVILALVLLGSVAMIGEFYLKTRTRLRTLSTKPAPANTLISHNGGKTNEAS